MHFIALKRKINNLSEYFIRHCVICRLSQSTVSEAVGIEPGTVTTLALAVRCSYLLDISHLIFPYLNLAVYVVPRLPVELPADADPGIVDITPIWLFMWSYVCQSNSPQTQNPALLILPQFGCLCGPTSASRTPRRRRIRHCWYYLNLAVYVVQRLAAELPADADPPRIVEITSIWLFMWSHVCQSNSPQTQTAALLIRAYRPASFHTCQKGYFRDIYKSCKKTMCHEIKDMILINDMDHSPYIKVQNAANWVAHSWSHGNPFLES